MNRQALFNGIRASLFGGMLSQAQVAGIEAILDAWELEWSGPKHIAGPYDRVNQAKLSCVLATAHHETNATMEPIKEYGGSAYYCRMYDIKGDRPHIAKALGNDRPGDGAMFCGRGFVQLTGRANYARQTELLEIDLVSNPDLMLDAGISAKVLVAGMLHGEFTGQSLDDYFDEGGFDFVGARRIVNGTDQAVKIAGYAAHYLEALEMALPVDSPVQSSLQSAEPQSPAPYPVKPSPEYRPPDHVWRDPETGEIFKSWNADDDTPGASAELPMQLNTFPDAAVPEKPAKPNVLKKIDGWKTHVGMVLSGAIGVAAMFGIIPGMSAEAGAAMLQTAFGVSGFRSAIPKIIQMGISFYLTQQLRSARR